MTSKILLGALALALVGGSAMAAKIPTDAQKLRQEAEHACYEDVQKLCNDAIPDEDKIKSCMGAHHAQLSPTCAKIYDRGLDG